MGDLFGIVEVICLIAFPLGLTTTPTYCADGSGEDRLTIHNHMTVGNPGHPFAVGSKTADLTSDFIIRRGNGKQCFTNLHFAGIKAETAVCIRSNNLGLQAGTFQLQGDGLDTDDLTYHLRIVLTGVEIGAEFRLGEGQLNGLVCNTDWEITLEDFTVTQTLHLQHDGIALAGGESTRYCEFVVALLHLQGNPFSIIRGKFKSFLYGTTQLYGQITIEPIACFLGYLRLCTVDTQVIFCRTDREPFNGRKVLRFYVPFFQGTPGA